MCLKSASNLAGANFAHFAALSTSTFNAQFHNTRIKSANVDCAVLNDVPFLPQRGLAMTMKLLTRLLIVLIPAALTIAAPLCSAQSAGSAAAKGGDSESSGLGFSIETEMLTYKSLEANSEAIACDIARRLYGGELGPASGSVPCTVQSGSSSKFGVVIVSSSNDVAASFQLWRADMASMNALELRGSKLCTADSGGTQSRGAPAAAGAAAGAAGIMSGLTPAGQILPLAQSVIGMFASNESVSPVTGTIHDQALMNGVARQLKALGISVLIPEIYDPFALGGAEAASSPFLSNLEKLIETRSCLAQKIAPRGVQPGQDEISNVIASIDAFLEKLAGSISPANASAAGGSGRAASAAPASGTAPAAPAASPAPSTENISHLVSVLTADGLARAIGVGLDGTVTPNSEWQHVLWLKALESGGSVAKQGNILGSKTRYSGGAVSTYSLYNFDGNLDCSGNVYDYEGSVLTKNFSHVFREQVKDPTNQLSFVHGSCGWAK
jgi:hypothetical protein